MTQQTFWRGEVERLPLTSRLAYIESQFPGSYGCGWEEGMFYPIPQEDAAILQSLWEETFVSLHGKAPDCGGTCGKVGESNGGGQVLWNTLRPHKAYLLALKERLKVDVFLDYCSNCDHAGVEVPPESLEMFTELQIPFGLSIIIA